MKLANLQSAFRTSPTIALLKSGNAPIVLDFLHTNFKAAHRQMIPEEELRVLLADYQEELQAQEPTLLPDGATYYLTDWTKRRFLTRSFQRGESGVGDAVFQLTSYSEKAIAFVEGLMASEIGFVGTESRVRLAMETLKSLVVESSDDPVERVAQLEAERARIDAEIESIQRDGIAPRLDDVEIRERFGLVVDLLRQVQGDFRHVEESFKTITRELQRRQLGESVGQGELLGYALGAETMLGEEDQGRSFEAFTRLILSPESQDELYGMITRVAELSELATQRRGLATLKSMPDLLLAEARKVMETTQRLSGSLRLLLDDRASEDHRRIRGLLTEIRELATASADDPPEERDIGLSLDPGLPRFRSPMARTFFQLPQQVTTIDIHDEEQDKAAANKKFKQLAALARLDWQGMRHKIRDLTKSGKQVGLGELLTHYPPESGAVEVVGYVRLAKDGNHLVDSDHEDTITLPGGRQLEVPRVTFIPSPTTANA